MHLRIELFENTINSLPTLWNQLDATNQQIKITFKIYLREKLLGSSLTEIFFEYKMPFTQLNIIDLVGEMMISLYYQF